MERCIGRSGALRKIPCGEEDFLRVPPIPQGGSFLADGSLPDAPSFSCPKRKRKGPAVPMRRPPAGAAAPDPEMRPPDDGLFTGLGAGEQGMVLKPFPGYKCWSETFRKVAPNPVRLFRFASGLLATLFQIFFLAQAPQGLSRPSSGGRTPRVQGRSPGRRPPPRNGGGLPRRGKQRAALFPKLAAAFSGNLEVAT